MRTTERITNNIYVTYYREARFANHPEGSQTVEIVKTALDQLSIGGTGRRLMAKIDAGKHPVYIKLNTSNSAEDVNRSNVNAILPGVGSASFITLAYHKNERGRADGPFFIRLAHELIHAYHNSYGKSIDSKQYDPQIWSNDEEYHTIIGFPSKKADRILPKITENSIRLEHQLEQRLSN